MVRAISVSLAATAVVLTASMPSAANPTPTPWSRVTANSAANAGTAKAAGRSFTSSVLRVADKAEQFFEETITPAEGDFVAANTLAFEYSGNHSERDLTRATKPGGTSTALLLNGGAEGRYRLALTIKRTAAGTDPAYGKFDEFEVRVKSALAIKESVNDAGSGSDEPVFTFVYSPLFPAFNQVLGPISGFGDIDTGEKLSFSTAGVPTQRFRLKVPRKYGVIVLTAVVVEDDGASDERRTNFSHRLANHITSATDDERKALGKALAG